MLFMMRWELAAARKYEGLKWDGEDGVLFSDAIEKTHALYPTEPEFHALCLRVLTESGERGRSLPYNVLKQITLQCCTFSAAFLFFFLCVFFSH
jgi:hypothetical protein